MEGYSADLTTDGKTIFIDLIDVGCEGVTGYWWFRVEFVMNTAITMNEVKCFFSLYGGMGLGTEKLYAVVSAYDDGQAFVACDARRKMEVSVYNGCYPSFNP